MCNPEAEGAPYLNHAIAETEAIAALFDVQAIVGPDATETRLVGQASQANWIHIAAHGQFNSIAPQFSRIYLAPDDENDGLLEDTPPTSREDTPFVASRDTAPTLPPPF